MNNRKIDASVAEHVMEEYLAFPYEGSDTLMVVKDQASAWFDYIPHYSTDIAEAWRIVCKLTEEGYGWRASQQCEWDKDIEPLIRVVFWKKTSPFDGEKAESEHTTFEKAVCEAALKLKGIGYAE